jgi:hypothetical protein
MASLGTNDVTLCRGLAKEAERAAAKKQRAKAA